jgi:Haemolymph juvenile hormone binding protein (JHBP)
MLSQYNIKGRVLLLPIHGQGQSNITMCKLHLNLHTFLLADENALRRFIFADQLKAKYIVKSDIVKKKNGLEYIKVNSVDLKLAPGKSFINFENLFDGDKRLSELNNFVVLFLVDFCF